jgi:hypothetical protein
MPDLPQKDLAKVMRDRFHAIIDGMSDGDLMDKDFAPSLTLALKAQKVLDDREKVKAKQGTPELGWSILKMLAGRATPPPRQIEDGNTIEGTAVEVPAD